MRNTYIDNVLTHEWVRTNENIPIRIITPHVYRKHKIDENQIHQMAEHPRKVCICQHHGHEITYMYITPIGNYYITPHGVVKTAFPRDEFNPQMTEFARWIRAL